jgi:hypothetical protein
MAKASRRKSWKCDRRRRRQTRKTAPAALSAHLGGAAPVKQANYITIGKRPQRRTSQLVTACTKVACIVLPVVIDVLKVVQFVRDLHHNTEPGPLPSHVAGAGGGCWSWV